MILYPVDKLLGMLEAHPNGNPFRLKSNATTVEHLIGVACRMPRGQNHRPENPLTLRCHNPRNFPIFNNKVVNPGGKTHLSPAFENCGADSFDYLRQTVGAYMGMSIDEYLFRSPVSHKCGQYFINRPTLLAAGV